MWVYSEKQKTWVNLEQVQRIASDGQGGYLLIVKMARKHPSTKLGMTRQCVGLTPTGGKNILMAVRIP